VTSERAVLVHLTTTDMSLELLLGPQLEAFERAGYDVVGVSAPGPYVAALAQRGVRHVPLAHATRAMAPLQDVRAFGELVGLLRRLRPAIVHTHNPKPGLYGRVAARLARVPAIVNTVHGIYALPDDPIGKRLVVYGLERVAATCSHAELVQNPEDVQVLRRLGVPDRRLRLLGNGIDLARFDPEHVDPGDVETARRELGAGDDDVVVGVVGRLVREKGLPELFEAARRVRVTVPNVRIAVIGPDDPDKIDALTDDDRRAARSAGVQLLGARDDVVRLYRAMDIYVIASHREGFPRSAMEAAAMGVPIIATDVRGCRQVVEHGLTGLLVPVRDPAALAAAIAQLATDADRRSSMGRAAREKAARDFDQQRCIDITLSTYGGLLRTAGLPVPGDAGLGPVRTLTVRAATAADVPAMALLHDRCITEGFLATLGASFLRRLYRRIVRSPEAFALVAAEGDEVRGFVAVAHDTRRLYREFLLHDAVPAGAAAATAAVRAPARVLETLRYGTVARDGDLPHAEILAVAVDANARERGIGRRLVSSSLDELRRRGIDAARVVTVVGNEAALRMYVAAGFELHSRTEVHRGVPQEVLVWR
jgi:glycosyltransferase involved in cell wall biosynthesis/ribosomal protein S18 acetylase RimI-like enzyme